MPKSIAYTNNSVSEMWKEFLIVAERDYIFLTFGFGDNVYSFSSPYTTTGNLLCSAQSQNHQIAAIGDADENGIREIVVATANSCATIFEVEYVYALTNKTVIHAPDPISSPYWSNSKVAISDVYGGEGKEIIIAGVDNYRNIGINIYGFNDSTLPSITLTSIPSGSYNEDQPIWVNATITDNGVNASGVNRSTVCVWVKNNTHNYKVPMIWMGENNYSANLQGRIPAGTFDYFVNATDLAGNSNSLQGGSFTLIESGPPIIHEIIAPSKVNYSTNITVKALVTDATLHMVLLIYNTGGQNVSYLMTKDDEYYVATLTGQQYGIVINFWIYANDSVPNEVYSSKNIINVVDEVKPIISGIQWSPASPVATEVITISATVEDPAGGSGLKNVKLRYTKNNGSWSDVEMVFSDGKFIAQLNFSEACLILFEIVAEDNYGNVEVSEQYQFNVAAQVSGGIDDMTPVIILVASVAVVAVVVALLLKKQHR
ncbi:MAG: hypothetical protein QXL15_04770 [Candidatus Korarchaeota archaeon]